MKGGIIMSVELKALIFGIVSLVCYIITGVSCRKYKDKYKTYSADEINTYFTNNFKGDCIDAISF